MKMPFAPVREAGIPIQVKNTGRPEDEGTAIVASRDVEQDPIIGISVKKGLCQDRGAQGLPSEEPSGKNQD